MLHQFSSMLAGLLIVIASVTVLIMLEMNSKKEEEKNSWIGLQRFLGYLFLILFSFLLAYMVFRAGAFQEDSPTPIVIFALLVIPLIMIKVAIARQKIQISTKLILLGTAIFGLSFGLTGIAAKYYAQHSRDIASAFMSSGEPGKDIERVEQAQSIMNKKCSKCHSLERVYTTAVSDWTPTVNKMAAFDYPNITSSEVKEIVSYLNQQQEKRKQLKLHTDAERGRKLVSSKCGQCHELDRVFRADKNEQGWRETVNDMVKIMADPKYLSEQEQQDIVSFLTSRRLFRKELWNEAEKGEPVVLNGVRSLVARKCSAGCHALDRVLRTEKTPEAWRETVNSMIEMTGDPEYLSEPEKQEIINFLSLPPDKRGDDADARPKSSGADHPLISRKCGTCHDLERIYQAGKKKKEEWAATVSSMAARTNNPEYLSEQEKKDILTIIGSWKMVE